MICTHPVSITDKETAGRMSVPCGHCMACRFNHAKMWQMRLWNENKMHDKSSFVTLTYNENNVPEKKTLVKKHVQKFFKKLRKIYPEKIRFFACGEYGDLRDRPHYHSIIFGLGKSDINYIERAWDKGFITVDDVTQYRCRYVALYVTKKLNGVMKKVYEEKGIIPEFSLMSRRPGIGQKYLEKYGQEIVNRGFMVINGNKVAIPKYYKKKLFEDGENAIKEEARRGVYILEEHKKRLDKIAKIGYSQNDVDEKLIREKTINTLQGRNSLKRRKL